MANEFAATTATADASIVDAENVASESMTDAADMPPSFDDILKTSSIRGCSTGFESLFYRL